jgi:hypothetical protein
MNTYRVEIVDGVSSQIHLPTAWKNAESSYYNARDHEVFCNEMFIIDVSACDVSEALRIAFSELEIARLKDVFS